MAGFEVIMNGRFWASAEVHAVSLRGAYAENLTRTCSSLPWRNSGTSYFHFLTLAEATLSDHKATTAIVPQLTMTSQGNALGE